MSTCCLAFFFSLKIEKMKNKLAFLSHCLKTMLLNCTAIFFFLIIFANTIKTNGIENGNHRDNSPFSLIFKYQRFKQNGDEVAMCITSYIIMMRFDSIRDYDASSQWRMINFQDCNLGRFK